MEDKEEVKKRKYYTGIGSRDTSKEVLEKMESIATSLFLLDYYLRSGGAQGADQAFEAGVKRERQKRIYLPWNGFNDYWYDGVSYLCFIPRMAMVIANEFHPRWDELKISVKKLHARNVLQVLGSNVSPSGKSDFVICYTEGGKLKGGTAMAIKVAQKFNVPVFNLGEKKYKDMSADEIVEYVLSEIS